MKKVYHIKIKLKGTGLNFQLNYVTFEQNKVLKSGVYPHWSHGGVDPRTDHMLNLG